MLLLEEAWGAGGLLESLCCSLMVAGATWVWGGGLPNGWALPTDVWFAD